MEWLYKTISGAFDSLLKGLTDTWGDALWEMWSTLFMVPAGVLNDPDALRVNEILVGVALAAMPCIIAGVAIKNALERANGTSIMVPEELLSRSVKAGLAVTGTTVVTWFFGKMADTAVADLAALGVDLNLLKLFFVTPGSPGASIIILSLLFLVGAAIVAIQRLVLAAELTILLAIGPLMGLGYLRSAEGGTWSTWLREVGSILVTPPLQLLLTWFFIQKFADAEPLNPSPFFAAFAYLYVLFKMPRWARELMYSAGGGNLVVAGAAGATRWAMMTYMWRSLRR